MQRAVQYGASTILLIFVPTLRRVVRHFEAIGSVDKKAYPSERSFKKKSSSFVFTYLSGKI